MTAVAPHRYSPALHDPLIFVRAEARKDSRIHRKWLNRQLLYWANTANGRVESKDILDVYVALHGPEGPATGAGAGNSPANLAKV